MTEFPGDDRRSPESITMYRLGRVEALAERTADSVDKLETQVTRLVERSDYGARRPALFAAVASVAAATTGIVALLTVHVH